MAIVAKKETHEKYSHLKKLYNEDSAAEKTKLLEASDKEIKFVKEELVVSKKDVLKTILVTLAIGLVSLSGFLIQRFM